MSSESEARKAFADHLRSVAEQLESGEVKDCALVMPLGWSGVVKNPMLMQGMLFDAMCAVREMGRAKQAEEMRKLAPRVVVPVGVGGMKLN